jgi:hypothetical protein
VNQQEIEAVRNHISNIPAVGAMYAPVLLEWLEVAMKERDDAIAALRLIKETGALREFAYERGDDDASLVELVNHVLKGDTPS